MHLTNHPAVSPAGYHTDISSGSADCWLLPLGLIPWLSRVFTMPDRPHPKLNAAPQWRDQNWEWWLPSKYCTLNQCWFNVGSPWSLKTENKIPWFFHDVSMIPSYFPGNKIMWSPASIPFWHMQPRVVKYQAKKKMRITNKIPWFFHEKCMEFFRPNSRFSRWVGTLPWPNIKLAFDQRLLAVGWFDPEVNVLTLCKGDFVSTIII